VQATLSGVPPGGRESTTEDANVPSTGPTTTLGRFQIKRTLGEGAFGRVYEAYDPQLDRVVALKVAKPTILESKDHVRRFLREARAAANLRHPHIVPVFDAGGAGSHLYIASALIRGRTLDDAVKTSNGKQLDYRAAARVIHDLAEALDYAHRQGIVHRDVKPSNVLLDEKGEPLLTDFGLAARQQEADRLTHEGTVLGTPRYMAPEQAAGQKGAAQPASDQYSLGVMLYEWLCGRPPFEGSPATVLFHHLRTEPAAPRRINPAVPRDLETVCLKAMANRCCSTPSR
jgi:serine/threonine protein kinase